MTLITRAKDMYKTLITVVVPIRNRSRLLSSVLSNLQNTQLKERLRINMLFITNACTDYGRSEKVILDFFNTVGKVCPGKTKDLSTHFTDQGLSTSYKSVTSKISPITYYYLDTKTAGKSNVLNIANTFARTHRNRFAICIDSDSFPQKDAISKLVARAYSLSNSGKKVGAISGRYIKVYKKKGEILHNFSPNELLPSSINNIVSRVKGALMLWDTKWLAQKGGFPATIREDAAIEVMALYDRRDVVSVRGAVTWIHDVESINERKEQLIRQRVGGLQIMKEFPHLTKYLRKISFYMRPWPEVKIELYKWVRKHGLTKEYESILDLWRDIFRKSNSIFARTPEKNNWYTRDSIYDVPVVADFTN